MIPIDQNTKIAFLIRNHPEALETIIGISTKFKKLRNPVLRKLLAGRATISMAAGVAGCSIKEFMDRISHLGFRAGSIQTDDPVKNVPLQLVNASPGSIIEFDVREILQNNHDPLPHILKKLRSLKQEEILKIINSFEPRPLMTLLEKRGYGSYTEKINPHQFETYFFIQGKGSTIPDTRIETGNSWDEIVQRFSGKMEIIDVRELEMPGPMLKILDALDQLPGEKALFVHHKRIPLFLLPELADRKFAYSIKEISETEVHMLIFRA